MDTIDAMDMDVMDGMTPDEKIDYQRALEASLHSFIGMNMDMNMDMDNDNDENVHSEHKENWKEWTENNFINNEVQDRKTLIEAQNAAYNASLEADRAKDAELLKKQTEVKSGYEADIDEVVSSIPPSRDELRKLRAGFIMSLKLNK